MKKMLQQTIFILALGYFLSAGLCTKVVSYGSTNQTDAVIQNYNSSVETVMDSAKKTLETLGYAVMDVDLLQQRISTGWRATSSDSHYLPLFKRKDYGAGAGGYYQLVLDFTQDGSKVKVAAFTKVQSVAGKLSSSNIVETKFLERLDNQLRSPQIVITNVGMEER